MGMISFKFQLRDTLMSHEARKAVYLLMVEIGKYRIYTRAVNTWLSQCPGSCL